MLLIARRRPEHVLEFLAGHQQDGTMSTAAAELPGLLVSPLPALLHGMRARTGAAHLSAGFLQDSIDAAALAVWLQAAHLLQAASRRVFCTLKSSAATSTPPFSSPRH